MNVPAPMDCIADACPSPMMCAHRGECRGREIAAVREYHEALSACREMSITDPFKTKEDRP